MRREVAGLGRAGVCVVECAVKPFEGTLVEELDIAAKVRTAYVRLSPLRWLGTALLTAGTRPRRFARALWKAFRIGRTSRRGVLKHVANVFDACALVRLARGCDVLHAHFTTATTIACFARMLGGPPVSLGLHGPEEFSDFSPEEWRWKARESLFLAAVCEATAQRGRDAVGAHLAEKVRVVRCGLDAMFLSRAAKPVPSESKFLCVARLDERKGHALLLRAHARVREAHPDATLTLIGDGPLRADLERSRTPGVRFLGWGDHATVVRELESCRCLVLPSDAEGLPIVIMESLALGRPVIATDVGGVRELVRTGETGWLVRPGDEAALTRAMLEACAANSGHLALMGKQGKLLVHQHHDADANMRALVSLWNDRV
jgi:glycosyltransferase involved in cell wall biosynthesis